MSTAYLHPTWYSAGKMLNEEESLSYVRLITQDHQFSPLHQFSSLRTQRRERAMAYLPRKRGGAGEKDSSGSEVVVTLRREDEVEPTAWSARLGLVVRLCRLKSARIRARVGGTRVGILFTLSPIWLDPTRPDAFLSRFPGSLSAAGWGLNNEKRRPGVGAARREYPPDRPWCASPTWPSWPQLVVGGSTTNKSVPQQLNRELMVPTTACAGPAALLQSHQRPWNGAFSISTYRT